MGDKDDEARKERLRKAQEQAKARQEARGRESGSEKPEAIPRFVPYGTMFKLEFRPFPNITKQGNARVLECVNCGMQMPWSVYTLNPEGFDKQCPDCKMVAREFWRGKLHKEIDDA